MNKTEILSPSHLYSIVQIYLEDKFDTAEGNTLYIYNVNSEKLDSESVLLNYLYKHNHEADKDKTLKDLKWKRSEEHTSELQSRGHLVCRLLLEKKKRK